MDWKSTFPDCQMPDGADPCRGYAALYAAFEKTCRDLDGALSSALSLRAERDAVAARAEAAEAALEQAQEWNRQMVEKAASGGVLDGYREIGAKLAAAETALEEALSAADIAATAYERRMTEMALQKGEALLAQGRAEAEAKQLRKDLRRAVMRCRYMSSNPENPCLAPDAECCDCAASISAAIRTEGEG